MNVFRLVVAGVIALVVLMILGGSFYTIDQGERGAILRTGAFAGTAEPGLHFKVPFLETVVKVPMTQQTTIWSCTSGETDCPYRLEMAAYSFDQQAANLRVSITWHVPPSAVEQFYSSYRTLENLSDRLIGRLAPQIVKTVFGQYTAVSVIQKRAEFNSKVQSTLEDQIKGPIVIDSVQVENIDFSDAYEQAIESRMTAEVEVAKSGQKAENEKKLAEITVTQAKAQADSKLAIAKADAESIKLRGEAEAEAIKARGDALRDNPGLIGLTQAEKWNGQLPNTMVPGGAIPFLDVK